MSIFTEQLHSLLKSRAAKGYKYNGVAAYAVTLQDAAAFEAVALKFGFPPEWLANLVNFESGGTFNPGISNSIGATGLIQFLPSTALKLGTTVSQLKKMSFLNQLAFLEKYISNTLAAIGVKKGMFNTATGKVTSKFTQADLFMAIFYPEAIGSPNFSFPAAVTAANSGIKLPVDYVKRALAAATAPFRDVVGSLEKSSLQAASYAKRHWASFIILLLTIIGSTYLVKHYLLT